MAHIDKATIQGMDPMPEHVNVSGIVGIGGTNEKNDVMLVQALFKLLGYDDATARNYFGMCKNDLPQPTGIFWDNKTPQTIWGFQRTNVTRLLSMDGKIHPANYKNRVLKHVADRPLMAITFLNMYALDGALMLYGSNLTESVKKIAPEIVLKPFDPWA